MFYAIACLTIIVLVGLLLESHKRIALLESRDSDWSAYADHLESEYAHLSEQLTMLQSFYRATYAQSQANYAKLVATTAKAGNGNGNGSKQNQTPAPQTATAPANSTLASLGTITPDEQSKIDTWRKNGKSESDMCKWITNQRNAAAKKTAKATTN